MYRKTAYRRDWWNHDKTSSLWDSDSFWDDWESWDDWSLKRQKASSQYRKRLADIWGWSLSIEDEIPHLKGIKSFAKLLQGPGKKIIVKFERSYEAPAYYNQKSRVVAVCYGGEWKRPLKEHEWWAEAMVAHEIGHVRFTPDYKNFPVWNLIEDRRIEESMSRLFSKIGEKFRQVALYVLSNYYGKELSKEEDLAYPACIAFHWFKAEPTVKSLEALLEKQVTVEEVNGYPVGEFLKDLKILVDNALFLVRRFGGTELKTLYKACKVFQAKYFPADGAKYSFPFFGELTNEEGKLVGRKLEGLNPPDGAVMGGKELRPVADKKMSDTQAERERKKKELSGKFAMGKYNSVDFVEECLEKSYLVETPEVPSISSGVVRKFISFFPQAVKGKTFAEEGTRLDMRRYVRDYDDVFVAPKKTPAPFCIDVVVDGSGSMRAIEDIYLGKAYVRKTLRLLQEAEKVSNLRFRVMITSTDLEKPLFFKGEYEGKWSKMAFCFWPYGDENFTSAVPYLKSKVVLVITDGCFVLREDVEVIGELAKKKTLIGLYIQGEYGYPYEKVKPYMSNFHRFLHIKDESELWKVGKVLARFVR